MQTFLLITVVVFFILILVLVYLLFKKTQEAATLLAENKSQAQLQAQQKESFEALSAASEGRFKSLAETLLKEKTTELKQSSKEIFTPLTDNLNRLQDKLARMQNLNENLQKEASSLTAALQNNKTQGDFGEMLLEQLLQNSGLKEGQHYQKQMSFKDENGNIKKPDFIINLPGGRYVLVDAKMSLTAYNAYVNETDPTKKETYLKEHLTSIKEHIKELSDKSYQELKEVKGRTPDFVVMYVPIEGAYLTALNKQKDLGIFAGNKKVATATASSLFPILKAIENLWAINNTQKNMDEIITIGKKLHAQAADFAGELQRVGNNLTASQNAFQDAMTKLQGKQGILFYAKKLETSGVKSNKNLPFNGAETEEN